MTKTTFRWLALIALPVMVLALAIPVSTGAQESSSYQLGQWTYAASAGGNGASTSYTLHGTMGQESVTGSSATDHYVFGGIWRGTSAANILVLEKTYRDEIPPVAAGDEVLYVVAVTNNGYRDQHQVVVSDTIPAGLTLVSGSAQSEMGTVTVNGDTITLRVVTLTYEEIAVLTYRTVVDSGVQPGDTITNTATARSTELGLVQASASLCIGLDTDGDGIPDEVEGSGDTDGDGTPDYLDDDSDGDGVPDSVEGYGDTDGDGLPDFQDTDSDGDGIPDSVEGYGDTDGDGIPNFQDDDSDGDGIPDSEEGTGDSDGDGIPDYLDNDDNDGPDGDADGDGILNGDEDISGLEDADGDGILNLADPDSDNDGIPDSVEAGDSDPSTPPVDSDGDGLPDFVDTDSDNDGIPDSIEGTVDTDSDGIPDYLDEDSDGDGVPDAEEGLTDDDGDGIPDYADPQFDLFLPLLARNYSSEPSEHEMDDAPDVCPGQDTRIGNAYHDDWDWENDNDWYTFQADAGQTYTIQTSELEARADTILTLYAADCATELAQNDDIAWPDNVASRIVWTAPTDGAYCVLVRSYDWQVYGAETGYTFSVEQGGTTSTTTKPMSAPNGGKPAPPPTPIPGTSRAKVPGLARVVISRMAA